MTSTNKQLLKNTFKNWSKMTNGPSALSWCQSGKRWSSTRERQSTVSLKLWCRSRIYSKLISSNSEYKACPVGKKFAWQRVALIKNVHNRPSKAHWFSWIRSWRTPRTQKSHRASSANLRTKANGIKYKSFLEVMICFSGPEGRSYPCKASWTLVHHSRTSEMPTTEPKNSKKWSGSSPSAYLKQSKN